MVLFEGGRMPTAELKLNVSVLDMEPVTALIDIITSYPKEKLPDDLREKLDAWYAEYFTAPSE
jgi:hypothetical protein